MKNRKQRRKIKKYVNRELKLRVQRQTTNVRQRKNLRYKTIRSKWACCFITRMLNYSCQCHMKENMTRRNRTKIKSRKVGLAVPANVKLKLPKIMNRLGFFIICIQYANTACLLYVYIDLISVKIFCDFPTKIPKAR